MSCKEMFHPFLYFGGHHSGTPFIHGLRGRCHYGQFSRIGMLTCWSMIGVEAIAIEAASDAKEQTGYSSVGRASDCRVLQLSDGPWFDSGWPDFATSVITFLHII